ncbi:phage tail protein [Sphingomonas koreensis]|uniref:phage tail protein n=1 Tax=Sphingomonas koreensis TaxID=93064 RepID=UPI000837163E|nr:phage tail protein [Sphingomonas koreensis]PJI89057.1 hypothetical protein BDW16_2363 [Sphingomonas koreensis]
MTISRGASPGGIRKASASARGRRHSSPVRGEDVITINALLVPEIAGSYGAIEALEEMANTGDSYPLLDGLGRVLGNYRIERMEETHRSIMAGGIPRQKVVSIELVRSD